jgi:hypothetical protein
VLHPFWRLNENLRSFGTLPEIPITYVWTSKKKLSDSSDRDQLMMIERVNEETRA